MEESANGDEKVPKAENVQDAPSQDARVYSISWTIREDDRVSFVGQKFPPPANYRFFASKVQWDFEKWTFIFVHFWIF